jgi:outer membrane protein OmpA-like peptidoglycan-associated protein
MNAAAPPLSLARRALAGVLLALAAAAACAAPDANDVATLNKTRTIQIEAVPACDLAAANGAGRTLQVGADALSLRIEFQLGTSTLTPGAAAQLDRLAGTLRDPALAHARFIVAGHTDARGSDAVNVPLSCARAQAVRDYLQQHGVDAPRLQAEGFGARLPLPGTQPLDGVNRRVEVRRLAPQKETP